MKLKLRRQSLMLTSSALLLTVFANLRLEKAVLRLASGSSDAFFMYKDDNDDDPLSGLGTATVLLGIGATRAGFLPTL